MEDGAVLGLCLAKSGKGSVPLALHTFFQLRHDHVVDVQQMGIEQREDWHNNHDESGEIFKA
ncbi:FAD/NAD(P)-binding domain-containing protein [Penicillium sp. IBT 31633x]|nr:FAD/NAD(P)-binding domain-containing protein [Penicillium sp. IBT 31633x]